MLSPVLPLGQRLVRAKPTEVCKASTVAVAEASWWVEDECRNVLEFHDDFSPPAKPTMWSSALKSD